MKKEYHKKNVMKKQYHTAKIMCLCIAMLNNVIHNPRKSQSDLENKTF